SFTIVLILFEGEGDVECSLVLGKEVVALRGPPGDRAKDAAVLAQRHFQVALLELARTVDDLHSSSREHRAGVSGAERRQRGNAARNAAGNAAEGKVAVNPQPRHQVVGTEGFIR